MTVRIDNVVELPRRTLEGDLAHHVRLVEALLFASAEPLDDATLRTRLPPDADLAAVIGCLSEHYRGRGVTLERVANGWAFRTAPDLAPHLRIAPPVTRKLSRAAAASLAILAHPQPVPRPGHAGH